MNRISKSFLSIVMCMLLLLSISVTAFGAGLTGSGTEKDPYLITSAADLDAFSAAVAAGDNFSGKYVSLQTNVAVSSAFIPVGTAATPFAGVFLGNGNSLTGFNMNRDYAGVFAYTDGAVISDLSVAGTFRSTDYAGAVVAFAINTVIDGCTASASVSAKNYAGGVAGYIESGKISGCTVSSRTPIIGTGSYCGGIAGYSGAVIEKCSNSTVIFGAEKVGGIAGSSAGDILGCTNVATITASSSYLGGIAGYLEGAVINSMNKGNVSSNGTGVGKAGGIAGAAYGAEISGCVNAGAVSVTGDYAGGIAGFITNASIDNCVSAANVSIQYADYAGGIFGYARSSEISKCVATAGVSASSRLGGIGALCAADVKECYYNGTNVDKALASGTATDTTAITAADITNKAVYTKLDFEKTWTMNTVHANYPLPKNAPYHTLSLVSSSDASCTEDGLVSEICLVCQETVNVVTPAFGHSYKVVSSKAATCTVAGYEDVVCSVCSHSESTDFPAKGHVDADGDDRCDVCKVNIKLSEVTEKTIFQKIADFFKSILEWLRGLFS